MAPSRVDRNQLKEIKFSGLEILENYSICPPIYRISQINNEVLNDFWFRVDNGIISENMKEFGDFVYEKITELKNRKLALNAELQNRIPINSTKPNQPVITCSDSLSKEQAKPTPESQTQQEFSFIPPFLRKK